MELELVSDGLRFPEGPLVLRDGSVVFCQMMSGTLSRRHPDGTISTIADVGGGPNGAAIGSDGAVYVANNGGVSFTMVGDVAFGGHQHPDYIGGRIQRVTLDGEVTDLYVEGDRGPLRGPNDLIFDGHGGFYFTDSGKIREQDLDHGTLYYAAEDGSSITSVVHPLAAPNGVGLSPDGSRLYVSETMTGRLWYWDVEAPGRLTGGSQPFTPGGGTLLHGFGGYTGLDSLAVDSHGNVNVGTLFHGSVSTIAPDGRLVGQVGLGLDPFFTNITFGGPELTTAYITGSGHGRLYRATWPVPGLPPAFEAG
ncbi:SMP-30/gluconolactonase/LRE family protein [Kutzneria kofuensis]|uniref:Gluconolactonase n=1 Tax=Kutzneria kofuensis TaxID=103725 RepID=A0A7W9KQR6_9PSEU|nr:SMP-30/gluconolactonase/LRE family protein [Kutzneria kofuensis]MBB5897013.1 gluconolactonase [Kutzneria kofuensis]